MMVSTTRYFVCHAVRARLNPLHVGILCGLLASCAATPPPLGAPVVDRTLPTTTAPAAPVAALPPPPPTVEVQPLQRPATLEPQPTVITPPAPRPPARPSTRPPTQATPPRPAPETPSPPETPPRQGNQAVATLLNEAASHVSANNWEKAEASLERALRIEPRNASIWHDLAQIRLQKRDFAAAESTAMKSNSLAGNDRFIKARNWRLIAVARRAQGNAAGADAAEAQAITLERP